MRFILEIWDYTFELAAFTYFGVRLWVGRLNVEIHLYKPNRGGFLFQVDLPLIHITNTMHRETVSQDDDPYYHTKNLTSGKVLFWEFKI